MAVQINNFIKTRNYRLIAAQNETLQNQVDEYQRKLGESQEELVKAQEDLTETQGKLAVTEGILAETQGILVVTEGALAEAREELTTTQGALAETQGKLVAAEAEYDTLAELTHTANQFTGIIFTQYPEIEPIDSTNITIEPIDITNITIEPIECENCPNKTIEPIDSANITGPTIGGANIKVSLYAFDGSNGQLKVEFDPTLIINYDYQGNRYTVSVNDTIVDFSLQNTTPSTYGDVNVYTIPDSDSNIITKNNYISIKSVDGEFNIGESEFQTVPVSVEVTREFITLKIVLKITLCSNEHMYEVIPHPEPVST